MPDYAACRNKECLLRSECARYRMIWGEWQSVGLFEIDNETGTCEYFWPVSKDVPFGLLSSETAENRFGEGS